jgi:hypothetical protein
MINIKNTLSRYPWRKTFVFLSLVWIGLNFFQAILTEVMSDEAYYFLYGKNLAWGYYDHPPMVGLMTFLSGILFEGNLSVRFMTIIFQFATLIMIWKIIGEKMPDSRKVLLFFVLSASLIMFQAYGFVTAPDVPFLFFTALFLFGYKQFLTQESWINTFLLAISMAGMFYSKYHAVVVIGLIVLSNLKLLSRYKFWMAGFLAIIFLLPHIYWQVSMDFPGFKYHLSDRSSSFKWRYFWEYLPNQLAVFNPFTFGALVYVLIKYKAKDVFERGMYFIIIGFIAFFWIMTFRGHVEPHWTVACSIPIVILLYRHNLENAKLLRYTKNIIAPSLLLLLVVRVLLVTDILPQKFGFSGKAEKSEAIASVADNLPVVFTGSFQNPSNYNFFTGKEAVVLSGANSRATQFDIWQKELEYQNKPVFICREIEGRSQEFEVGDYKFDGFRTENFQSVNRINIEYDLPYSKVFSGDTLRLKIKISNPTSFDVNFHHKEFPVRCEVGYATNARKGRIEFFPCEITEPISILNAESIVEKELITVVPTIKSGVYQFIITLVNDICPARNSKFVSISIIND